MITYKILVIYIFAGAITGFLSGLLGIGGGIVVVPALTFIFALEGFGVDFAMKAALGTSMATILFTSLSSVSSHNKHKAVLWKIILSFTPGIFLGTVFGSWISTKFLSAIFLKSFFALFLLFVAIRIIINSKTKASRSLPESKSILALFGLFIGFISSLLGVGGGTMTIPFLTWCNVSIRKAVGTSAGVVTPIALFGSIGYLINGLNLTDLPPYSLGYIYFPALIPLVLVSMLVAPLGVKVAHGIPTDRLRKIFALVLIIVSLRMFAEALKLFFTS